MIAEARTDELMVNMRKSRRNFIVSSQDSRQQVWRRALRTLLLLSPPSLTQPHFAVHWQVEYGPIQLGAPHCSLVIAYFPHAQ